MASKTRMPVLASVPRTPLLLLFSSLVFSSLCGIIFTAWNLREPSAFSYSKQQAALERCRSLRQPAGPPPRFREERVTSDRFVVGTSPVLISNATIFTGQRNGTEVVYGDMLLDRGIVKALGYIPERLMAALDHSAVRINAGRKWVTPGLVDLHSHVGVFSVPFLRGALDAGSDRTTVQPWLRSLDGLNTHDDAYKLAVAGGVTSAQILPGSGNAIGGQAFLVKFRPTSERSPSSMVIEPPQSLSGSVIDKNHPPRWRHMKSACGENLIPWGNRMDTAWDFRSGYEIARKIKVSQDSYCSLVDRGRWSELPNTFPEDLQWEALVDVLRGRVKLSWHCYQAVDFDSRVRNSECNNKLTNEFKFPVASFHHASEAYLVPDLLKKTWGGAPTIAMFATTHRYKLEAFRGSEFAPKILADHGIRVVMKSDHPIINSRYLAFEAQQAHYFGLPSNLALASITTTPAETAGLGHRIGTLVEGTDADVVIWDSHPLALGATPERVFIDGIPQLHELHIIKKPSVFQNLPIVPDFTEEARETVKYDGLPPLLPHRAERPVVFTNVSELWTRTAGVSSLRAEANTVVVSKEGQVICSGTCSGASLQGSEQRNLMGGVLAPTLLSYGAPLGLQEIQGEVSTSDGTLYGPLTGSVPKILGDSALAIRAVDGLQFQTRDALLAYRSGVTEAVSAPGFRTLALFGADNLLFHGISTAFSTGAIHAQEKGAVRTALAGLHVTIGKALPVDSGTVSVSTQIAALRRALTAQPGSFYDSEVEQVFRAAARGGLPLVVDAHSADVMATLLRLKKEVDQHTGHKMRLVFAGAGEAHLIASEIGEAQVGLILIPARPFPNTWDTRRIIPGPPLSAESHLSILLAHNITVGLGVTEGWAARLQRFDVAWAALEAGLDRLQAYALASSNLEKMLGVAEDGSEELVAYSGGDMFNMSSKAVAVVSSRRGWTVPSSKVKPELESDNTRGKKRKRSHELGFERSKQDLQAATENVEKLMRSIDTELNTSSPGSKRKKVNKRRGSEAPSKGSNRKAAAKASLNRNHNRQQRRQGPVHDSSSGSPLPKHGRNKEFANSQQNLDSSLPPGKTRHREKGSKRNTIIDTPKTQPDAAANDSSLTPLQRQMRNKLEGARFRHVNEVLYKSSSANAHNFMREDSRAFDEYHAGFRRQVESWPQNPVDNYIQNLSDAAVKGAVIADLGCGEAALARALIPKGATVLSFDLVSDNEFVIEADICTKIPLPGSECPLPIHRSAVVDIVVCALSLMGTNWLGCIREAWRVLRPDGELKIAEVASRINDCDEFIGAINAVGFRSISYDETNSHFVLFNFRKTDREEMSDYGWETLLKRGEVLQPCEYKRR